MKERLSKLARWFRGIRKHSGLLRGAAYGVRELAPAIVNLWRSTTAASRRTLGRFCYDFTHS